MNFLILGDSHGQIPKFYFKDFDAIITPGDFCPIIRRDLIFKVIKEKQKNPKYKKEWTDLISKKERKKIIKEELKRGEKVLRKINSKKVPVFIVPGNADHSGLESNLGLKKTRYLKLIKKFENTIDCHLKIKNFKGYQIIGYGKSTGPEYPQNKNLIKMFPENELKKRKIEYKKKFKKINSLFKKSKKLVIFLSHNVPFNTILDKIVNKKSPINGYHYGSLVAREMIEKYQPLICIGGHMHEHFGKCKIGRTTCINAGYGSTRNILLELDKNKIKSVKFH